MSNVPIVTRRAVSDVELLGRRRHGLVYEPTNGTAGVVGALMLRRDGSAAGILGG